MNFAAICRLCVCVSTCHTPCELKFAVFRFRYGKQLALQACLFGVQLQIAQYFKCYLNNSNAIRKYLNTAVHRNVDESFFFLFLFNSKILTNVVFIVCCDTMKQCIPFRSVQFVRLVNSSVRNEHVK